MLFSLAWSCLPAPPNLLDLAWVKKYKDKQKDLANRMLET